MINIYGLKCESMHNPLGIDIKYPRVTWMLEADRRQVEQTAYQLIVGKDIDALSVGKGDLYDSRYVKSYDNFCVIPVEINESGARYYWAVKIWDEQGNESAWSYPAWWEMGLLKSSDWQAKWIEPIQKPANKVIAKLNMKLIEQSIDENRLLPCQLIRKEFLLNKSVKRARIYATAHGVYELELNGQLLGGFKLAPECTSYDKYIQYQTYDITSYLNEGANVIGAHIAPGWWSGIIGLFSASCQYGDKMGLLIQIEVDYEDGTRQVIGSDNTFKSTESPIRYSELFIGEKYDANYEKCGWSTVGYDDSNWQIVNYMHYEMHTLSGQNAPHICVKRTVKANRVFQTPKGETVIDFGQVMAGYLSIALRGIKGQKIVLSHSEELGTDGNFCINIPGVDKNQKDIYIFGSDSEVIYEPKFVYHGFRYVKVEGHSREIDMEKSEAKVIFSDLDLTCAFECSDKRVTKLHDNLVWTTMANMMSIPTDNPDRERGGWTGDAQMYLKTASYHFNVQSFFGRWMNEMRLEQDKNGRIPLIVPNWISYSNLSQKGAAGWGDACVIIPWILYLRYGDKRVLEDNYNTMKKWIEYIRLSAESENPDYIGEISPERAERLKYIWNTGYKFGDWLTPSTCTTEDGQFTYTPNSRPLADFLACCYFAHITDLTSQIAELIGNKADVDYYKDLNSKVRKACVEEMLLEDGTPQENLQGAKVLALAYGFVPMSQKENVINDLLRLISENDGRMDTGFSSTECLLDVLSENGYIKEAFDRLFCNKMPSWLYEVEKGATGIWESWQAIMPDGKVNPVSFIQCAAGSVGNWIYRNILGISEVDPGFKTICLKPELDERISFAKGEYDSLQGKICSHWCVKDNRMTYKVGVPPNASAYVYLPNANLEDVTESGFHLKNNRDICKFKQEGNKTMVLIGSGKYVFEYCLI